MPRGTGDIPALRLETITDFITRWKAMGNLVLKNLFPESDAPSDTIKWEDKDYGRALAQFMAPETPTPKSAPEGIAEHSATAAMWGDKRFFSEKFLNNLRKPGTHEDYMESEETLSENLGAMINRCERRKEWMFAQMLSVGTMAYQADSPGVNSTVDYGIATDHIVSLTSNYKWENGSLKDIVGDVIDAKKKVKDDCGGLVDYAICNSTVLKFMARDTAIQNLLQKSAFGNGDLYQGKVHNVVMVNPQVVGALLDIKNLVVYDELYEVKAWLTGAVTASSTTSISVDNASDFVAGGTLRFIDVSANTYEEETIASVDIEAGTVTVSSAPSTSYKAGEDYVTMKRSYIADDKIVFFASTIDGQPIAKMKRAPFGIPRGWGLTPHQWNVDDPDGIYLRVQDKGLPVLYHKDAVYILDVN